VADFTDLAQVRALAEQLLAAGGFMGEREVTVDGHEKTFQVNHLAPFLLTTLLLDRLVESQARVLNTSSLGNRISGHVNIDDLDAERGYRASKAYGDAKLENILFTKELHHRYHAAGISTAAFHPGSVASNFGNEAGSRMIRLLVWRQGQQVGLRSRIGSRTVGPQRQHDRHLNRAKGRHVTVVIVDAGPSQVSRSVEVNAPAAELFAIVADPRRHHELDGSGTVGDNIDAPAKLVPGARFATKMKMFGVPYRVTSVVTALKPDELIEWRHPVGHHWRWEFAALTPTTTKVTETFDYSDTGPVKDGLKYYQRTGFAKRNAKGIEATLTRLRDHYLRPTG
jgi:NAD(P)-dependent dehydrogenase (short-subunit alcohol dehydrogenase family)